MNIVEDNNAKKMVVENEETQMDTSVSDGDDDPALMTPEAVMQEGRRVIKHFLKTHTCYDLVPQSGKVIVFDVDIPVKLCFYALVEHGVASAPLLDPATGRFVGMFTASDFIEIIRYFYKRGSFTEAITDYSIHAWRALKDVEEDDSRPKNVLVSLTTKGSLYDACRHLRKYRIHRIPIMHPRQNSVLGIASHLDVLKYLVEKFREDRRLFDQCIFDLGIGQFRNVITAKDSTPLITVLDLFAENKISSIPILDGESGQLKDVYCSSYVTHLGKDTALHSLKLPVGSILDEARKHKELGEIEEVHTCSKRETLHSLFQCFAKSRTHRIICVDDEGYCEGIVTLSDLLNYFLEEDDEGNE